MSEAERKVRRRLPAGAAEAIAGLSGSQLRTLLLGVARDRAGQVRPADLVRRWRQDRFVRPAAADPRAVSRAEARLWELLPLDVYGTQLSPVVPLGTVTAVAPLGQAHRHRDAISEAISRRPPPNVERTGNSPAADDTDRLHSAAIPSSATVSHRSTVAASWCRIDQSTCRRLMCAQ